MSVELPELPFILALQRAGTLTAAARSLGIDHSTAFRRLRAIEQRLQDRLFDRLPGGVYQATPLGEKLAGAAARIADEVDRVNRDVLGTDRRLSGVLRVTASESIAHSLLIPHLHAFQARHPGIDLVLDVSNRQRDLARREADIAVRTVRPAGLGLWGRKIARIAWATYERRQRSDKTKPTREFIGWDTDASDFRIAHWIEQSGIAIRFRTSSLLHQQAAARAGVGVAVLPCYLADTDPFLQRADPKPIAELRDELWIVAHEQLRKTARIRAFLDSIAPALRSNAALIEGREPWYVDRRP